MYAERMLLYITMLTRQLEIFISWTWRLDLEILIDLDLIVWVVSKLFDASDVTLTATYKL